MAKARKKSAGTSGTTTAELEPMQAVAPVANETETPRARRVTAQDAGNTTAANLDRARVASRAYELYIQRGGQHGRALDDWLEAEQELLQSTRRTRDRD